MEAVVGQLSIVTFPQKKCGLRSLTKNPGFLALRFDLYPYQLQNCSNSRVNRTCGTGYESAGKAAQWPVCFSRGRSGPGISWLQPVGVVLQGNVGHPPGKTYGRWGTVWSECKRLFHL